MAYVMALQKGWSPEKLQFKSMLLFLNILFLIAVYFNDQAS